MKQLYAVCLYVVVKQSSELCAVVKQSSELRVAAKQW